MRKVQMAERIIGGVRVVREVPIEVKPVYIRYIPKRCKKPVRYVNDDTRGPLALCAKHFQWYFDQHYTREIDKETYNRLMKEMP